MKTNFLPRSVQKWFCLTTFIVGAILVASSVQAQLLTYNQDFNSLPTTSALSPDGLNFTWTDNSTLSGWYFSRFDAGDNTIGRASNGNDTGLYFNSLPTARIVSAGEAQASDRALGVFRDGNMFGLRLVNTTGQTLNQFSLSFTGEQWISNSGSNGSLLFAYSTNGTSLTSGTYTGVSQLNYTNSVTGGTSTSINNTGAMLGSTAISHAVTGITWNAGEALWLRWTKDTNNHLLTIDDLTLTAVPEPSSLILMSGGLFALWAGRRRRRDA